MSATTSQTRVYGAAPSGPLPSTTFILVSDGTLEPIGFLNRATAGQVAELLAPLVATLLAGNSTPAPAAATAFTTALSSSSSTAGNAVTLTATPTGAAWPSSVVLTPAAAGLSGTFAPTTRAPSGTTAATFAFTPSAAGSGTISVLANSSMTAPAGLAYQATAAATPAPTPSPTPAPTPTPTPVPAPTSDGTLSGVPSTIAAGQQLSAVTYSQPQTVVAFILHRVATNADEGLSWLSNLMLPGLNLLIPQNAGAYTVRAYAYPGPESNPSAALVYESAQFSVTAAPGALPATPTQAADTGATATGVTMNWSSTAPSYLVMARPGVGGGSYGILARTTVTTNSYTFAGLSANSSPRAAIIPQNANGYGAAGLCFSSVSATAAANETLTLASPGPQASGNYFTLSGTYSGLTPTAFDIQRVGAPAWGPVASQSVTIGNGTFTIAGVAATYTNPNTAYAVRDRNNPANTATTPAFAVS